MNEENSDNTSSKRKFLGIIFTCCNVYGRLYKNKMGTAYVGRCPRCMRPIRVPINPDSSNGTSRRFFRAD